MEQRFKSLEKQKLGCHRPVSCRPTIYAEFLGLQNQVALGISQALSSAAY
jgi:hypothetical protein